MSSVTVLLTEAASVDAVSVDAIEVAWVTGDGVEESVPLCDAWSVPFESGLPVRRFAARKGQRHLSGLWWCATTGGHVGFESWLERDHLMMFDFDPTVVGVASQPLWLRWADGGQRVSHAPDYFARTAEGSAVLIDCRPVERRPPRDLEKFAFTAEVCRNLGWKYRLLGAPDQVLVANMRWLAGYRHPRYDLPEIAEALRRTYTTGARLIAGACAVGDPLAVLPVVFHMLWRHELTANLSMPLHDQTWVATVATA